MTQRYRPSGQKPARSARRDGTPGQRRTRAGRTPPRPAGRRGAASGPVKRTRAPEPRGWFTGRVAVLALVLAGLVLAYAYPVRTYLAQRAEITRLEQSQDGQRERIATLAAEREKWNDDEYVRTQARKRLHYVRPGETAYVVIDGADGDDDKGDRVGDGAAKDTGPWYSKLWSSVGAADKPRRAP